MITNLSKMKVPATRKKRAADSLEYSPSSGMPSQELKGIKNNPSNTNKRLKLILLFLFSVSNDSSLYLIVVLV